MPKAKRKVYSIDTPPPYVNTPVHIGQATTYVLMDMFARYKRMKGFNVLFPFGLDRNGLPIEMAVEKRFSVKLTETPRERFIEYCHKVLEESSDLTSQSFLKLGISFNSWKKGAQPGDAYETDSADYRRLTQETFIDMWKKGLIYEDERINNYCPGCQTTLADAEVVYEDIPTTFNDVIFKVKETNEEIIISTTRPELICTCAMVVYNPEDERYQHLNGKTAITPIFNKEVKIQPHPIADIEKGSGLVMMCSAGDLSDIRFFREMNLPIVIAINQDGRMNSNAGFLEGLKVSDARKKIIEELKARNLITKQSQIIHRTPICERSKDPIEFISMKEFYVKQIGFKEKIKELADEINFYDPKSKQILLDWIDSISIDWPISRRRYYATEIPLWYCKKCNYTYLPEKGRYYRPWKEKPDIKKCPECGNDEFVGETRVFDTWFDSSISPLYILKYSDNPDFFERNKPCTLRPQGKEIIRTWLYYTLLKCYHLTGECIFKDVWINYHILDEKGRKMSKSLGNVIDPLKVIDEYGAEPFRLWASIEGNIEKTDFKCSMERISGAMKTLTKLWNVARFISMFKVADRPKRLCALDEWIISEINNLIKYADERYNKYDFHGPGIMLKNFLWETFSSHYLELVKNRAYNQNGIFTKEQEESALFTLHYCLRKMLQLWSPINPFITYRLYNDIYGEDVHSLEFPEAEVKTDLKINKQLIMEFNSAVWKYKKDNNLSLKSEITELSIPEELKVFEDDLKAAHRAKRISYGELKIII